jgi:RNA polymerase sigma-70 factor (ECF subfamily)
VNDIRPALEPVELAARPRDSEEIERAVVEAFDRHEGQIYGLALAVTRDPDTAADLTQEAFMRLLQELRRGRAPDNVGAWLCRTTSNLAISRGRRMSVARRFAPRLLRHDAPETPDVIAVEHERSRTLRAALARLPVTDRVALVLAAQGWTGEEIAAHLGKSHGAVRNLLLRARGRLRESLAGEEAAR